VTSALYPLRSNVGAVIAVSSAWRTRYVRAVVRRGDA
jgi:hypothetical protein